MHFLDSLDLTLFLKANTKLMNVESFSAFSLLILAY